MEFGFYYPGVYRTHATARAPTYWWGILFPPGGGLAPARPLTQPVTHPFSPTRAARRAARAAVGDGVVLPTPGLQTGIMVRGKTKIPGTIMSKNGNNGKTTSRGRWRLGPSTPICATEGAERGGAQVGM